MVNKISNEEESLDIIKEYRDLLRVNGMSEVDINTLTSIDEHKIALKMQKKLNAEKAKSTPAPEDKEKPKILPIDMSRENARAFADGILQYQRESVFDERAIRDERYKRDNQMITDSAIKGDTVIIRDENGRAA